MSGSLSGIGGVDASIPLQAGRGITQPLNPLQQVGEFASVQNALNQNKLFPGQMQLQQQAVQGGQVSLAQQINQAAYQGLTPLLAKPPGTITHDDFTTALASMEANLGIPTHGVLDDLNRTAPTGDGPNFDQKVRSIITARAMKSPESSVQAVTGTPTVMANGQSNQPGVVAGPGAPGFGGFQPSGPATPVYPSRDFLASQVGRPVTPAEAAQLGVPPGTMITEPMSARLAQQGAGGLAGPAAAPASPFGTGRLPTSLLNPNRPQATATPPASGPNPAAPLLGSGPTTPSPAPPLGGPVVTALAPGAQQELEASTDQYNRAMAGSNTFKQRTFPLEQALTALQNTNTGPGTETTNQIKSFLLAQSPWAIPGVDPTKIQNFDEAAKYLAQYAMNQPGAAGSDMARGMAQVANASTHISNQAAQQVVTNVLGLERMQQAAVSQFNATHPPGSSQSYSRWLQSDFMPNNDPRGFSWDNLPDDQKVAALKGMTPADKLRLRNSVETARQSGFGGAGSVGQQ